MFLRSLWVHPITDIFHIRFSRRDRCRFNACLILLGAYTAQMKLSDNGFSTLQIVVRMICDHYGYKDTYLACSLFRILATKEPAGTIHISSKLAKDTESITIAASSCTTLLIHRMSCTESTFSWHDFVQASNSQSLFCPLFFCVYICTYAFRWG